MIGSISGCLLHLTGRAADGTSCLMSFTHHLIQATLQLQFENSFTTIKTKVIHLKVNLVGHLEHNHNQQMEFELFSQNAGTVQSYTTL